MKFQAAILVVLFVTNYHIALSSAAGLKQDEDFKANLAKKTADAVPTNNGTVSDDTTTAKPTETPTSPTTTTPASTNTTVTPDSTTPTTTVTPTTPTTPPTTTVDPSTTSTTTTPAPSTTSTVAPTTSTVAPSTSTVAPSTTTAKPDPAPPCRRFDGPSFIGGIVLTLGLIAIGFVSVKIYKSKTERNYHTL